MKVATGRGMHVEMVVQESLRVKREEWLPVAVGVAVRSSQFCASAARERGIASWV